LHSLVTSYRKTLLTTRFDVDVYDNISQIKLFGSCFGHQLISASILGRYVVIVEKSPKGWEIGVHPVALNEKFKKDFPLLQKQSSLTRQFLHADHVVFDNAVLPDGWTAVGSSKLRDVQGMYYPGRVLTLQGHPELEPFLNEQIAMQIGLNGAMAFDQVMSYMSQVRKEDDSILCGETPVEFFAR
jgi:GMP synthase-like glutamine amidotransferase